MMIIGMIIATIVAVLSFLIIGPYGIGVLLILLFGLVFSTYQKNKQIYEDLKTIREKLGLLRDDEILQIEINKNFEEYDKIKEESQMASDRDKEIEEELEKYIKDNENKVNVKKE